MRILFFIVCFISFWQFGYSQTDINTNINNDTILFPPDFFDQTEPLELTLEFDIKKYMNEKAKEEYLPAKLTYFVNDSSEIEKNVRIRARGISRQRHCRLPPFWLNIKESNIIDDYISDSKKIKVVTLCRNGNEYTKYLLNEYIIYRLYNIITDKSFKVRLLRINYIDTGKRNKESESWAFMIEPENLLAKRLDAFDIKIDYLNYKHTDSMSADIMCFFQYMIGNTDFTVNGRHNVKLFKYKDIAKPLLIPIPYDFDFAGLVNADYANPAEILDMESVTERYFLGLCRSDYQYLKVINIFEAKKDEMYSFIDLFEYLDRKSQESTLKYLDEFYKEMSKPNFIENSLRKTCR